MKKRDVLDRQQPIMLRVAKYRNEDDMLRDAQRQLDERVEALQRRGIDPSAALPLLMKSEQGAFKVKIIQKKDGRPQRWGVMGLLFLWADVQNMRIANKQTGKSSSVIEACKQLAADGKKGNNAYGVIDCMTLQRKFRTAQKLLPEHDKSLKQVGPRFMTAFDHFTPDIREDLLRHERLARSVKQPK